MNPKEALLLAVERAGSRINLAKKIGLETQNYVDVMINRDEKASLKYVHRISQATGVSLNDLRPDIFTLPANDPINPCDDDNNIA